MSHGSIKRTSPQRPLTRLQDLKPNQNVQQTKTPDVKTDVKTTGVDSKTQPQKTDGFKGTQTQEFKETGSKSQWQPSEQQKTEKAPRGKVQVGGHRQFQKAQPQTGDTKRNELSSQGLQVGSQRAPQKVGLAPLSPPPEGMRENISQMRTKVQDRLIGMCHGKHSQEALDMLKRGETPTSRQILGPSLDKASPGDGLWGASINTDQLLSMHRGLGRVENQLKDAQLPKEGWDVVQRNLGSVPRQMQRYEKLEYSHKYTDRNCVAFGISNQLRNTDWVMSNLKEGQSFAQKETMRAPRDLLTQLREKTQGYDQTAQQKGPKRGAGVQGWSNELKDVIRQLDGASLPKESWDLIRKEAQHLPDPKGGYLSYSLHSSVGAIKTEMQLVQGFQDIPNNKGLDAMRHRLQARLPPEIRVQMQD